MRHIYVRVAVGLTGLLLFLIACGAWVDPARVAAKLGMAPVGALGLASLRADLGSFFATGGSLAITAALRRSPELLNIPLLMLALALIGRFMTLTVVPFDTSLLPPMVAEALMVGLLVAGRWLRPTP